MIFVEFIRESYQKIENKTWNYFNRYIAHKGLWNIPGSTYSAIKYSFCLRCKSRNVRVHDYYVVILKISMGFIAHTHTCTHMHNYHVCFTSMLLPFTHAYRILFVLHSFFIKVAFIPLIEYYIESNIINGPDDMGNCIRNWNHETDTESWWTWTIVARCICYAYCAIVHSIYIVWA